MNVLGIRLIPWIARIRRTIQFARRLHGDESGVISLLAVFVMLGCTWLLLWILNSARELDSKVRLQVAADAAGLSGANILVRGMNGIAFSNQFEAELFAAVAVMEASAGTAAEQSPLLALLPVYRQILSGNGTPHPYRPITAFRYDLIRRIPGLAIELTQENGRINGQWRGPNSAANPDGPQGPLIAQLWTTLGRRVDHQDESDPRSRTLPVLDPSPQGLDSRFGGDPSAVLQLARQERMHLIQQYLLPWATDLAAGDTSLAAQLVTRSTRFRVQLTEDDFPDTNLPFLLRHPSPGSEHLEADLMFIATVSRQYQQPMAPRMFWNPHAGRSTASALAQVHVFLPRSRYICCPWVETTTDPVTASENIAINQDNWPSEWSASSQNWQAKLVPVTAPGISRITEGLSFSNSGSAWGTISPRQADELIHH